jgi:hypothetical protein
MGESRPTPRSFLQLKSGSIKPTHHQQIIPKALELKKKSELDKLGSQQAHNQSDGQDRHTKHCEQGLYLAETTVRQYLSGENTLPGQFKGLSFLWIRDPLESCSG